MKDEWASITAKCPECNTFVTIMVPKDNDGSYFHGHFRCLIKILIRYHWKRFKKFLKGEVV